MASKGTNEHLGDSGRGWWMISFPPRPHSHPPQPEGDNLHHCFQFCFQGSLLGGATDGHRAHLLQRGCLPLLRLTWGPSSSLEHSPSHALATEGSLTLGALWKCVYWIARWSVCNSSGLSHTEKIPGGGYLKTRNEDLASFSRSSNFTMMTGERLECHLGNIFKETCAALREETRQLSKGRRKALFPKSHSLFYLS